MDSGKPPLFLKTDDNTCVNENAIYWMRKLDKCIYVCTRSVGCGYHPIQGHTHKICEDVSTESFRHLLTQFQTPTNDQTQRNG